MTFLDNGSLIRSANLNVQPTCVSGTGQCVNIEVTLTPGSRTITANYSGNGSYVGSSSLPITVNEASIVLTSSSNPSATGQPITLTATLSPSNATGMVEFVDGYWSLTCGNSAPCSPLIECSGGVVPLSNGQARCVANLVPGPHSITAVYGGDSRYGGSASPALAHTVTTQVYTTTTLSSFPNPSIVGNSVTFTATVSPYSQSGTVTFVDGGTNIGSSSVTLGSTAQFATKTLSVGNHSITAVYSGGPNGSSTSAKLIQVVQ